MLCRRSTSCLPWGSPTSLTWERSDSSMVSPIRPDQRRVLRQCGQHADGSDGRSSRVPARSGQPGVSGQCERGHPPVHQFETVPYQLPGRRAPNGETEQVSRGVRAGLKDAQLGPFSGVSSSLLAFLRGAPLRVGERRVRGASSAGPAPRPARPRREGLGGGRAPQVPLLLLREHDRVASAEVAPCGGGRLRARGARIRKLAGRVRERAASELR